MRRVLDAAEKVASGVCVLALAVIVVAVSWQVVARYVTEASTAWAPELASLAFVWCALFAIPVGVRHSRHMLIDVWYGVRRRSVGMVVTTVAMVVVVVVCLVLAYFGYSVLSVAMQRTLPGLGVSAGWVNLAVPFGFVLSAVFAVEAWWDQLHRHRLEDSDTAHRATV